MELGIARILRNQRDHRARMDDSGVEAVTVLGTTILDPAFGNRPRLATFDGLRSRHSGSGLVASRELAAESKREREVVENGRPSLPLICAAASRLSFAMDACATVGLSNDFSGVPDMEGRRFWRNHKQQNSYNCHRSSRLSYCRPAPKRKVRASGNLFAQADS